VFLDSGRIGFLAKWSSDMPENRGILAIIGGLLLSLLFGLFGQNNKPT
jgi:hypothetical protein